jgi:predicted HicB family RNase H-like nuclease
MAYKEKSAALRYNNDYNAKAYDRINLVVPKGRKAVIAAHAEAHGESLNGYVSRAIDERMARLERVQEGKPE